MMINVIAMTRRFICSLQVAPCRIRPCLSTAYWRRPQARALRRAFTHWSDQLERRDTR